MLSKVSAASVAILTALVVSSSWLSVHYGIQFGSKPKPSEPEAIIVHLNTTQYKSSGARDYHALSEQATQYFDQHITMQQPKLTLYNQTGVPPWHVRSQHGYITPDHNKINLTGGVKIWRLGNSQAKPLIGTTSHITLYPKQHEAITDAFVKVIEPGTHNITTGTGMIAYSQPARITLLSDVNSIFEPANFKKSRAIFSPPTTTQSNNAAGTP